MTTTEKQEINDDIKACKDAIKALRRVTSVSTNAAISEIGELLDRLRLLENELNEG